MFKTGKANCIEWRPGRLNLAEPGTKRDDSLTIALQLMLFSSRLSHSIPEMESFCAAEKSHG